MKSALFTIFVLMVLAANAPTQWFFIAPAQASEAVDTTPAAELAAQEASPVLGVAQPWQLNFQTPYSPVMEILYDTHTMLLWIIGVVCLLVLALTLWIIIRYNQRANPTPATFTHNVKLEVIWTFIPIVILIVIAVPSVRAHYFMEETPSAENAITLKVVGRQWYWSYEYPDHGGFTFDSYMLADKEALAKGEPRLLGVDNRVIVPVNTPVRVLITGGDVIHSWAIPALGVKRDAVPGRLNESWFEATAEGVYYGQCSELCGKLHGFMPIAVEAVSKEKFDSWIAAKQKEAGIEMPVAPQPVAAPAAETPQLAPEVEPVAEPAAEPTTQPGNETEIEPAPAAEAQAL